LADDATGMTYLFDCYQNYWPICTIGHLHEIIMIIIIILKGFGQATCHCLTLARLWRIFVSVFWSDARSCREREAAHKQHWPVGVRPFSPLLHTQLAAQFSLAKKGCTGQPMQTELRTGRRAAPP